MGAPDFRIGLFGLYLIGNSGDDLMAVIFGRSLQELGYKSTVYGLPAEQEQRGYSITQSLQEFVDTSDMIVYGGGGIASLSFSSPCLARANLTEDIGPSLHPDCVQTALITDFFPWMTVSSVSRPWIC